jgi:hypothetical protein
MQQHIFRDVARDPEVRQTVCRSLGRVIQDPEVHQLTWKIIEEAVIDNPRMKEVLASHWQSPRTKAAMQQASRRLEPTAVEIGEVLFGTPEDGLTPEFAHVLRNQILGKDRRWLVLQAAGVPAAGNAVGEVKDTATSGTAEIADANGQMQFVLTVALGSEDAIHPFVAQAEQGFWN